MELFGKPNQERNSKMKMIEDKVSFPNENGILKREDEYFILTQNGQHKKIRLHDYRQIYQIDGLYEYVLVELLAYQSHNILVNLLSNQLIKSNFSTNKLSVLELAAGVGLVGECLKAQGVASIIGIDSVEEAAEAVKRQRPNIYDRYYIEKLPYVTEKVQQELENFQFNCLVCASALTGGLPASAFAFAYNLINDGGWIVFNIREDLLDIQSNHNAGKMLAKMIEKSILSIQVKKTYQHRLSVNGNSLKEVALIGLKMANIPQNYLD